MEAYTRQENQHLINGSNLFKTLAIHTIDRIQFITIIKRFVTNILSSLLALPQTERFNLQILLKQLITNSNERVFLTVCANC